MTYKLQTPQEMVRVAIASCRGSERALATINTIPTLMQLCENLAKMICDVIPVRGGTEPLLHACIHDAWAKYRVAENARLSIVDRTSAFTHGLTIRLDEVNDVRVYIKPGSVPIVWKPSPETLYEFLSRHPTTKPRIAKESYADVDAQTCRQFIAARIIELAHMNAMGGSLNHLIAIDPKARA